MHMKEGISHPTIVINSTYIVCAYARITFVANVGFGSYTSHHEASSPHKSIAILGPETGTTLFVGKLPKCGCCRGFLRPLCKSWALNHCNSVGATGSRMPCPDFSVSLGLRRYSYG
ncbi:hypothetical protein KP509_25G014900 [Ceratopteris richardii]|uniref:Uncharacterized protein n=1 Tax=Ceratopteris richardii TaxID=49495 RepID=A0A8T2RPA9_CERRI|nr:hypothetical protein KP509_25G014900 [Ceratopteris richardii]